MAGKSGSTTCALVETQNQAACVEGALHHEVGPFMVESNGSLQVCHGGRLLASSLP